MELQTVNDIIQLHREYDPKSSFITVLQDMINVGIREYRNNGIMALTKYALVVWGSEFNTEVAADLINGICNLDSAVVSITL